MRQRIIFALVVALAAAGCQKKATGQSVAVVNGEEITSGELNDAMSNDQTLAGASTKDARVAELQSWSIESCWFSRPEKTVSTSLRNSSTDSVAANDESANQHAGIKAREHIATSISRRNLEISKQAVRRCSAIGRSGRCSRSFIRCLRKRTLRQS